MEPNNCDEAICLTVRRTTRPGCTYATLLQNPWAEAILRDFRWHEYMRAYPDLRFKSEEEARWHLVYNGYKEGRLFDPDRCNRLDPGYYRRRYPELLLETDAAAQFHYCYIGYYENRYAGAGVGFRERFRRLFAQFRRQSEGAGVYKYDEAICLAVQRTTRTGSTYATLPRNPWAEAILRDFRWHEYMRAQPDLRFESEEEARWHLVYNGYKEGRLFDPDRCNRLDPGYYRWRYPELLLETDEAAQFHYCYMGYYENRYANADTEWLFSADLHIYQHGRVGSHSIAAALEGCYQGKVLHLHWLSDMALQYPSCSLSYAHILGRRRDHPVRVISAGREVVSRVISGAFQFIETSHANDEELDAERVIAHLEDTFLHDCDVVTGWFDHQFHCGLDIYAHSFDHEKGYVRLGNDTVDLFLYRLENLTGLEKPLAEFLGTPDFKLSRNNGSELKSYHQAYQHLMRNFVLPKRVLEELYETDYMRFFFTEDERRRLIEYWSLPRGS